MSKITTKEELERTHLRFLKVHDNKKMSEILAKLLPNIVSIYFESDLEGVAMPVGNDNPKLKALEEIMEHLKTRVSNSKGEVKVPLPRLIDVFSSAAFNQFQNRQLRQRASARIFEFIMKAYAHLPLDLQSDSQNLFAPVIKSLGTLHDEAPEKSTLLVLLLHKSIAY